MRDIKDVIDRLLDDVIPTDELELRDQLVHVRTTALYLAPEMQRGCWESGAVALADRFGPVPPTEGWAAEAVAVWRGERTP